MKAFCSPVPLKNNHLYTCFSWQLWIQQIKYRFRQCLIYTSGLRFKAQFCMYAFYSSLHIWKSHLKLKHFSPPLLMCTDRVTGPLHMLELLQYQHLLSASCVPPSNSLGGMFLFTGKELLTKSELVSSICRGRKPLADESALCWAHWPYVDFYVQP